ncbi:MAG: DUF4406 domain-containing protein [Cetobacterium sp.]
MKVKKLFISQPMRGKSDGEILRVREEIRLKVQENTEAPVELLQSFFQGEPFGNVPVAYLGKSIMLLAEADIVYFGEGWRDARGCKIENTVAREYGLNIIEE